MIKNCDFCSTTFKPKKLTHRFCQSRCRKAWHRQRNGDTFISDISRHRRFKKHSSEPSTEIVIGETPKLTNLYTERNTLQSRLKMDDGMPLSTLLGGIGFLSGYMSFKENRLLGGLFGGFTGNMVGRMIDKGNESSKELKNNSIIEKIKSIDKDIRKEKEKVFYSPTLPAPGSSRISKRRTNEFYNLLESGEITKSLNTIKLDGKWRYFLGYIPQKFAALIYGLPKQGKTHLCLQLANYLNDKFGGVIYISAEEGSEDPFVEKYQSYKSRFKVIDEVKGADGIKKAIDDLKPRFVFIDSLTRLRMDVEDIKYFKQKYPQISFFYVLQATKDGRFRGSLELEHEVTSTIKVHEGKALQRGRTVNGESELTIIENWVGQRH